MARSRFGGIAQVERLVKFLGLLLLLAGNAEAATWIRAGLYIQHDLQVGEGMTLDEAISDMKSPVLGIPWYIDFIEKKSDGQYIECAVKNEIRDGDLFCDQSIRGNRYRVARPV